MNSTSKRPEFGMAAARTGASADLPGFDICTHSPFTWAELSADTPQTCLEIFKRHHIELICGDILEPELSQNFFNVSEKLQDAFVSAVEKRIESFVRNGYKAAKLNAGLDLAFENDATSWKALYLLKRLSPILDRTGFIFLLPVVLPTKTQLTPKKLNYFLKMLMHPNFRTILDIHPHDLKPGFDPEEIAGDLVLETKAVYFTYNADAGNSLVPAHIEPWIRYFRTFGFNGPYFSAPLSNGNVRFCSEADKYKKLIENFNQQPVS